MFDPRECRDCEHFHPTMEECRKNPPQVIYRKGYLYELQSHFPHVNKYDWCDCWEEKNKNGF